MRTYVYGFNLHPQRAGTLNISIGISKNKNMYVPAIAWGHKYDERKKSISGMNDLLIDFSDKEPFQFLIRTFSKKKE